MLGASRGPPILLWVRVAGPKAQSRYGMRPRPQDLGRRWRKLLPEITSFLGLTAVQPSRTSFRRMSEESKIGTA